MNGDVHRVGGGDISVWLDECGAVMLKVAHAYNDPVELGEGELDELIEVLSMLRREMSS